MKCFQGLKAGNSFSLLVCTDSNVQSSQSFYI